MGKGNVHRKDIEQIVQDLSVSDLRTLENAFCRGDFDDVPEQLLDSVVALHTAYDSSANIGDLKRAKRNEIVAVIQSVKAKKRKGKKIDQFAPSEPSPDTAAPSQRDSSEKPASDEGIESAPSSPSLTETTRLLYADAVKIARRKFGEDIFPNGYSDYLGHENNIQWGNVGDMGTSMSSVLIRVFRPEVNPFLGMHLCGIQKIASEASSAPLNDKIREQVQANIYSGQAHPYWRAIVICDILYAKVLPTARAFPAINNFALRFLVAFLRRHQLLVRSLLSISADDELQKCVMQSYTFLNRFITRVPPKSFAEFVTRFDVARYAFLLQYQKKLLPYFQNSIYIHLIHLHLI